MKPFLRYTVIALASLSTLFSLSYILVLPLPGILALYGLSHFVYCFALPFAVLMRRGVLLTTLIGWTACLLSGVTWEISYRSLFIHFGWVKPDLPGEVLFGLLFGWAPSWAFAALLHGAYQKRIGHLSAPGLSHSKTQPFDPHEPCEGP